MEVPSGRHTHILLNGVLSHLKVELGEFATNAFGSPKRILPSHRLDQVDHVDGQPGARATVTAFEFPEETKAMGMPAEGHVGFDDKGRIFPVLHTTDEENKQEPIGLRKRRLFDLTV